MPRSLCSCLQRQSRSLKPSIKKVNLVEEDQSVYPYAHFTTGNCSVYWCNLSCSSICSKIGGIGDITANAITHAMGADGAALTGGAMLLMWLGELITEQGIGNGISLAYYSRYCQSTAMQLFQVWLISIYRRGC